MHLEIFLGEYPNTQPASFWKSEIYPLNINSFRTHWQLENTYKIDCIWHFNMGNTIKRRIWDNLCICWVFTLLVAKHWLAWNRHSYDSICEWRTKCDVFVSYLHSSTINTSQQIHWYDVIDNDTSYYNHVTMWILRQRAALWWRNVIERPWERFSRLAGQLSHLMCM